MHIGHKVIASYLAEFTDIEKVMLVVSPQNPFKAKKTLLHQHHRLMIIKSEIENNNKLLVSAIWPSQMSVSEFAVLANY